MSIKLEHEVSQQLENPSFTKISMKAMNIWRKTEEGTELYNLCKELIEAIDQEQIKMDNLKSMLYLIAGKM